MLRVSAVAFRRVGSAQREADLNQQDRGQYGRTDPARRIQPRAFQPRRALAEIQHHHYENEKDHNRPGVNDHLQSRHERRAQNVEDDGHGQQGDHQIQERMHGVEPGDR